MDKVQLEWPAWCYIYGSWEYALYEARSRATRYHLKQHLYRGVLDGRPVWVVSWDPKKE